MWETELSSPKIKKFQEGTFQARKIEQNWSEKMSHIFFKMKFSYILGNGTFQPQPQNFVYFLIWGKNFPRSKNKKLSEKISNILGKETF